MPFPFNRGEVYQASFPYEEDEAQIKERPIVAWVLRSNGREVLAGKITGTIGRSRWEVPLQPNSQNGLVKPSVVRVDQMRYIPIEDVLFPRGTLNAFELAAVEEMLKAYIDQLV